MEKTRTFTIQINKIKVKHNRTIEARVKAKKKSKVKAKVTLHQKIIPFRGSWIYVRFTDRLRKKSLFMMMNS